MEVPASTDDVIKITENSGELYLYSGRSDQAAQTMQRRFLQPAAGWAGRCLRVPDAPLCGGELYLTPGEAATVLAAPPLGESAVHRWRRPASETDAPRSGVDLLRHRVLRWRRRRRGGAARQRSASRMAQLRSLAEAALPKLPAAGGERRRVEKLLLLDYPSSRDVEELSKAYDLLPGATAVEAVELRALRERLRWLIGRHLHQEREPGAQRELMAWYGQTHAAVTVPQKSCMVHHPRTHHLAMPPPQVDATGAMVVALQREAGFGDQLTDHEKMVLQVQLDICQLQRARCILYDVSGHRQMVELTAEPGWWQKNGSALLGFVEMLQALCRRQESDPLVVLRLLRRWEEEGIDFPAGLRGADQDQAVPYGDGQLHARCLYSGEPLQRQAPQGEPGSAEGYRIVYTSPQPQYSTAMNVIEVVKYDKNSYFGVAPS